MHTNPKTAAQRIKEKAKILGLDAVRITTSAPTEHTEAVAAWLTAGMHGKMAYLEKHHELRSAPLSDERLLSGARSVIITALSYDFSPPAPSGGAAYAAGNASLQRESSAIDNCGAIIDGGTTKSSGTLVPAHSAPPEGAGGEKEKQQPHGIVARYARGEDYHNVLWEKLNTLGKWIEAEWMGEKTRGFTDSGPIRERELAARAGLGWQGRHTNLISLDLGNWFFLGALLTTLELESDEPVEGHCGTCTRCLGACPTGALIAPMTLDARRCISYLTIELKGFIPRELRPLMGNRIFGCDDCLAACPWNEKAQAAQEIRLRARAEDAAYPGLLDWLSMLADDAVFKAKFAGTPLLRTGREGLRRNVCVALGNVGGEESLEGLIDVLAHDPSPVVRGHAAWALGEIARHVGEHSAAKIGSVLGEAVLRETDSEVRDELLAARIA
jgi:epoxyqueuosine reductase